MANGIAVGGFATGLSQGLQSGFNMAAAIDKDKREQAMFELQKEKLEMEREEARRKKAMQEQISKGLREIDELTTGGVVGGEAVDDFGTPLGNMVYKTPSEAKASGLRFKEGTTVEKPAEALTPNQISRLKAAVFQKARIDHGFMDEDSFEKARKTNKDLEKEGFQEAFDYFDRTNDSNGAVKLYNSNGNVRNAPAGTVMRRETDPVTGVPDIVVYAPDPKTGELKRITSRFEFHLANMPEELIKYGLGMKKEVFVQGQANARTDKEVRGRAVAAAISAGGKGNQKDEVKKRIDDIVFGVGKAVASNSQNAYDPNQFQQQNEDIATLALKLIQEGKAGDEAEAVSMARRQLNPTAPSTAIRKPK